MVGILNLYQLFVNYVFGDVFFAVVGLTVIILLIGIISKTDMFMSLILAGLNFVTLIAVSFSKIFLAIYFAIALSYFFMGMYRLFNMGELT